MLLARLFARVSDRTFDRYLFRPQKTERTG